MKKIRVIVCVFNNLFVDQRVEKICQTLWDNGYEVILIGNDWMGLPTLERQYKCIRLSLVSKNLKFAFAEFQYKLYHQIKKLATNSCIVVANDLDVLLGVYVVARMKKIPLVYDSHEIYTMMPSVEGRWVQKIWQLQEKALLPGISYMMTASDSYADWFEKEHQMKRPLVIRNFPLAQNVQQKTPNREEKIIFYQGAINPFRGIEKVILAMRHLPNARLVIAGDGPQMQNYQALTKENKLENRVRFLGRIAPKELRELTQRADVGLSIEQNKGLSYYYSLPNKISDYIQARVPVVVSDFPEMKKIVENYQVGELISSHEPEHLASQIQKVLNKGKEYYLPNLERCAGELCWEKQEKELLNFYHEIAKQNKFV